MTSILMRTLLTVFVFTSLNASEFYQNPISDQACADPAVFHDHNGTKKFYLACTGGRFPIRVSSDLISWSPLGKSIVTSNTGVAKWAVTGRNWAPALGKIGDNYVAYYTQNIFSSFYANNYEGRNNLWGAIGVSITQNIENQNFYEPLTYPLVRDDHSGGIIDPSLFYDPESKQHYLLYKPDSNGIFKDTSILIRPLGPKGLGFTGPGKVIATGGRQIEDLIEGPEMVKRGAYYYLFYSTGSWANTSYRVYVTRSKNIYGPYEGKRLVLSGRAGGKFEAPGHGSVVTVNSKDYYVYHAWDRDRRNLGRLPMLDRIYWYDGWPIVNNGHPSESAHYRPLTKHTYFHKVDISWDNPGLKNPVYSLDIKHPDGKMVGACISAAIIKDALKITYDGNCPSKPSNRLLPSTKTQFRICAAEGGQFSDPKKTKCSPFRFIGVAQPRVSW